MSREAERRGATEPEPLLEVVVERAACAMGERGDGLNNMLYDARSGLADPMGHAFLAAGATKEELNGCELPGDVNPRVAERVYGNGVAGLLERSGEDMAVFHNSQDAHVLADETDRTDLSRRDRERRVTARARKAGIALQFRGTAGGTTERDKAGVSAA